jgi:hypothetical protein
LGRRCNPRRNRRRPVLRVSDVEARARLSSILDVLEHEAQALQRLEDPRLDDLMDAIANLQVEILATLAEFRQGPRIKRRFRGLALQLWRTALVAGARNPLSFLKPACTAAEKHARRDSGDPAEKGGEEDQEDTPAACWSAGCCS